MSWMTHAQHFIDPGGKAASQHAEWSETKYTAIYMTNYS